MKTIDSDMQTTGVYKEITTPNSLENIIYEEEEFYNKKLLEWNTFFFDKLKTKLHENNYKSYSLL